MSAPRWLLWLWQRTPTRWAHHAWRLGWRLLHARCLRCGRLVQAAGQPPHVLLCGGWRCQTRRNQWARRQLLAACDAVLRQDNPK